MNMNFYFKNIYAISEILQIMNNLLKIMFCHKAQQSIVFRRYLVHWHR